MLWAVRHEYWQYQLYRGTHIDVPRFPARMGRYGPVR
jgi:hypothetical protein